MTRYHVMPEFLDCSVADCLHTGTFSVTADQGARPMLTGLCHEHAGEQAERLNTLAK